MSAEARFPIVNPRLRMHFAIFTSAVVGSAMLFIILEQLGISRFWLTHFMVSIPVSFAAAIGLAAWTNDIEDFYISGRRVPSTFNGFALAITAIGGTGFISVIGVFYFVGFDGLAFIIGWATAFVLLVALFAPYIRKLGTYTIPSFFALRFDSQALRLIVALALMPPVLLLLAAELQIGAFAASFVIGLPEPALIIGVAAVAAASVIMGGMRSLTWSQCAQSIVVLLGFIIPLSIIAIFLTNLPLPQLTYGTLFDDLKQLELTNGLFSTQTVPLHQALPSSEPQLIIKQFAEPFGLISRADFTMLAFCFMIGTACLPALLMRATTSPSVHDSRQSVGWGIFILGILLITIPAYAVFTKYLTLQNLIGATIDQLPGWAQSMLEIGLIQIRDHDQNISLAIGELYTLRDGILMTFPILAKFPFVLIILVITSGIAAAIAGAAAQIVTFGNMVSEDIYHCLLFRAASYKARLTAARLSMLLACAIGAWIAVTQKLDALQMLSWTLSIFAGTLFAPLLLAIFWKRTTTLGAAMGITVGFATTASYIWYSELSGTPLLFGIDNLVAAIIGVPASFIITIVASFASTKPKRAIEDLVDEMRSSEGEALYDRALRLAAQQKLAPKGPSI